MPPFNLLSVIRYLHVKNQVIHLGFAFGILFLLSQCANIVAPTGGEKDVVAPKELGANPPNQSINFTSKEITISFDEYFKLQDAFNQVVVSPPQTEPPEIFIKKKK